MCGLIFSISNRPVNGFINAAHQRQRYRGPNGGGVLFEEVCGSYMGMAHERLAIVDLTSGGSQPMLSASGRFRILFNGEIYNYRELAAQFGLTNLRSGSDTEVAVELIERLGIDEACRRFNGMWAMIVQDRVNGRFFVSRDRFGKKPLYFLCSSFGIYFASEMHSLLGLPEVGLAPDAVVAARFLSQSLQNIDDRSWIQGINSFSPASIGEIDGENPSVGIVRLRRFWEPELNLPLDCRSDSETIEELRVLVQDAIKIRLHADVPVGIALSGGIDSSILAAQAMHYSGVPQSTALFSAVNPGSTEDESLYVDAMARHLNCDVHRFIMNPAEGEGLFDLLRTCIRHADGPISSFSNVLFYKLMESARSAGITVVLTGQGADEAFCGYRKYPILEIKRLFNNRNIISATSLASWFIFNRTLISQFNFREAKRYFGYSNRFILGETSAAALRLEPLGHITTLANRQWEDISKYSVPYLCHYEDRMSMACSREVRSPFLDYRVVEMGLRMPERLKLAHGWTKYALRRAFEIDLPSSITWRKDKKGFVNPQDDWFKGCIQNQVRDIMSSNNAHVYSTGMVNRSAYMELLNSYCAGRGNVWFRDVFGPFALELWLQAVNDISREMSAS